MYPRNPCFVVKMRQTFLFRVELDQTIEIKIE